MKPDKFWNRTLIFLSILFFLQVISPFSKKGLFLGHDSQLHLIYLRHFEEAFKAGQIPVRTIDWYDPGLNQPLFNFYQPGVNYLFLIPRSLGFPYTTSLNILVISLWLLSALLMFAFAKKHFGTLGGILSAYFYTLAPYHILDVLIRSALPEFTALAFIPGVFWAMKNYSDSSKGFYLTLCSLFVALVTVSHPPTIIMFSPFIFAYLIYLFHVKKSLNFLFPIFLSIIFGFGIISFFLLPAFFEQGYVKTIFMRSGYYDFHNHFVCFPQIFSTFWAHGTSQLGCKDGLSFQLGLVHWFIIALSAIIIFSRKYLPKISDKLSFINLSKMDNNHHLLISICLVLMVVYFYMMLSISQPVWESMPYIAFIQYPWRFLAPSIFISSFLAGSILLVLKNELYKNIVFAVLILAISATYGKYLKPIAYATPDEVNFGSEILHETYIGFKNLDPEPGYMPKWTQILPAEGDRPLNEARVATQEAKIEKSSLTAAQKEYEIDVQKPTIARFYTHYFPGWEVTVDDSKVTPNFDNIYGYMDISLEPGKHKVLLSFKNTPIRSFANTLSLNFLLASLAFIFVFNKKRSLPQSA